MHYFCLCNRKMTFYCEVVGYKIKNTYTLYFERPVEYFPISLFGILFWLRLQCYTNSFDLLLIFFLLWPLKCAKYISASVKLALHKEWTLIQLVEHRSPNIGLINLALTRETSEEINIQSSKSMTKTKMQLFSRLLLPHFIYIAFRL